MTTAKPAPTTPVKRPALSVEILRNGNFRLLLITRMLAMTALQAQAVIVGWQVYTITKSPFMLGLTGLAEALPASAWKKLERLPQYEILTEPRQKAIRYKEQVVIEKEFRNQVLVGEDIAEIDYQPLKCDRKYRLVIVRKNLSIQKGEKALLDEIRYFFYITNRKDAAAKIVGLANGRCDQENVIEQLKNGVSAMRMPVNDLMSNWAYMVMAALAWNLKSWYGLLMPNRERGLELVKAEFRRCLNAILLIPCQIVRTARRIIYRVLGYNGWLSDFFATWERLQRLVLVE